MKRAPITLSENDLHQHIVALLNAYGRHDIAWWHCPNGELRKRQVAKRLKKMGVRPGVPDLEFVIAGCWHGLELKTERGALSSGQDTFRQDAERAGGFYHVAFGLDQAIGVLNAIRAFRPGFRIAMASDAFGGRAARTQGAVAARPGFPSPSGIGAPA